MSQDRRTARTLLSRRKKLLFSVFTTLLVFGGLEVVLWVFGVPPAYLRSDPYAEFATHIPHFVPQDESETT